MLPPWLHPNRAQQLLAWVAARLGCCGSPERAALLLLLLLLLLLCDVELSPAALLPLPAAAATPTSACMLLLARAAAALMHQQRLSLRCAAQPEAGLSAATVAPCGPSQQQAARPHSKPCQSEAASVSVSAAKPTQRTCGLSVGCPFLRENTVAVTCTSTCRQRQAVNTQGESCGVWGCPTAARVAACSAA